MFKYRLLNILSGGARPRYNSNRRVIAEVSLIGLIIYNIARFEISQIIALTPLIMLLSTALVRRHFLKERKKKREEEYLKINNKTIIAMFVTLIVLTFMISSIYYTMDYIFELVNINNQDVGFQAIILSFLATLMYWLIKIRIGKEYKEKGKKFNPSSEYQWRWREASFSYERGLYLAENESFLSAYYNFLNAKARFQYISSLEKKSKKSEDAEKLSRASELMAKYCRASDNNNYHKAERALRNAKTLVRVVSEPYNKKKCDNCGKNMKEGSTYKKHDKFICDECINFGGDNWNRTTKRGREVFDKQYTTKKSNRNRKKEKSKNKRKKDERDEKKKKKKKKKYKNSTYNNKKEKKSGKSQVDNEKSEGDKRKKQNKSKEKNYRKSKQERNKGKINQHGTDMSNSKAIKILGLRRPITEDDIKSAYREKAKELHPDAESGSTEKFKKLNKAKRTLLE